MKLFFLLFILLICGCVSQEKFDESQKRISDLEKQLNETKGSLSDANEKLAKYSTSKYQFSQARDGRTWRFDTVSGGSCIQLTTDSDWKRKETKQQSCGCVDLLQELNAKTSPMDDGDKLFRKMECGW